MRKIASLLLFALVLAGAGISVLWVLQSDKTEKNVLARIAAFNSGPMKITYDALEISGFPLRIDVNLVNPKLAGRMDLLLDPNKQKNLPEWNENAALQGTLQFGVDIFSTLAEFTLNGAWKNTSVIGGQTLSLAGAPETALHCALQVERSSGWMRSM